MSQGHVVRHHAGARRRSRRRGHVLESLKKRRFGIYRAGGNSLNLWVMDRPEMNCRPVLIVSFDPGPLP